MDWYSAWPPVFTGEAWYTCGHSSIIAHPWQVMFMAPRPLFCLVCMADRPLAAFTPFRPTPQAPWVNTY